MHHDPRRPPLAAPPTRRAVAAWAWAIVAVTATWGGLPRTALAFDPAVHRTLTVRSLRGQIKHGSVLPPELKDLIDFYTWLGWSMATRGSDEAGKARFRALFPGRQDFDGIGVRRLLSLSLDPGITVYGVTQVGKDPEPDRFSTLADASTRPPRDGRDTNRVAFTKAHERVTGPDGAPTPLDPRTLQHGPAVGPGSGEWAHTALPPAATGVDAPAAKGLRVVPVLPGVAVRGGAAEMAQLHMDLSVLAQNWGDTQYKQTAEYLSLVWLGGALHYVQDAASPLHTVQLSSPGLLAHLDAAFRARALRTGGGVWAPLERPVGDTLALRRRLRITADRLLAHQVEAVLDESAAPASITAAMRALGEGDPAFDEAVRPGLEPWLQPPRKDEPSAKGKGAVSVIVDSLAAAGAEDGAALYDLLLVVAKPRVLSGERTVAEVGALSAPLWREAESDEVRVALDAIAAIQARALRRAATATRMAFDAWLNANPVAALDRLRRVRTVALEREAIDVSAWQARTDLASLRQVRAPAWAAAEVGGALLLVLLAVGWLRRRRGAKPPRRTP